MCSCAVFNALTLAYFIVKDPTLLIVARSETSKNATTFFPVPEVTLFATSLLVTWDTMAWLAKNEARFAAVLFKAWIADSWLFSNKGALASGWSPFVAKVAVRNMTRFTNAVSIEELAGVTSGGSAVACRLVDARTWQPVVALIRCASWRTRLVTSVRALAVGTIPNRVRWARCYHHGLT